MGFVGEPDTDTASSSAATDEEAGSEEDLRRSSHSEGSPLISKARSGRGSNSAHSPATTRRRKRASTLKEIYNIWEELGDDAAEEDAVHYGTFNGRRRSSTNARPTSASAVRSRPHSSSGLDAAVADATTQVDTTADADTEDQRAGLLRSNSLPLGRRSRSARKRRHSRSGQGALFSDMLRVEWWRSRRRKQRVEEEGFEEEDEEVPHQNGPRDGTV
jgi:hypothetical protein